MDNELKPCPFCGIGKRRFYKATSGTYVRCRSCGAESGAFPSKQEAVEAWNRRAFEATKEQERLVVLPMQIGTPLFEVRRIFGEPSLITKAFDKSVSLWEMERLAEELGKTVFLTREEAEAALNPVNEGASL